MMKCKPNCQLGRPRERSETHHESWLAQTVLDKVQKSKWQRILNKPYCQVHRWDDKPAGVSVEHDGQS